MLWGTAEGSVRYLPLTPGHFERFRREARTLEDVAGTISIDAWPQAVREGERALLLNVGAVTGNFFRVLAPRQCSVARCVPMTMWWGQPPWR